MITYAPCMMIVISHHHRHHHTSTLMTKSGRHVRRPATFADYVP